MEFTAKDVSELRQRTGAGMMDCKKALTEAEGSLDKAVEILQKKNLAAMAKRSGRIAAEGTIGSYIHGGRIGVLVEVNSETDFVGRSEDFQALVKDICLHIAAANPTYIEESEIPESVVAKQKEIFLAQQEDAKKPANILEKIIEGKIKKWKSEVCLLDQAFVRDPDKTVRDHITELAQRIRENLKVRRFVRFELGEGIEKRQDDFAAEVAAAAKV